MNKIAFGTDGIRGIYGKTLTENTAFCLGAALGKEGELLLGRDNRPSSPALARAFICGAASVGGRVRAVGVITTPALYYLLSISSCAYAVMITASHNPPSHNGLKVFTKRGKLMESERREIEREAIAVTPVPCGGFPLKEEHDLAPYINYLKSKISRLDGVTAVVDYAGGAGSALQGLYEGMGAKVIPLNAREDGARINEGCGALYPNACLKEVKASGADLGISIDGDGDRIIATTKDGKILDGDMITYLLACRMRRKGALNRNRVAMTVMTNGGVLKSLTKQGITPVSCAVGDAALAETMRAEGLNLGGEQSGHVILGDYLPTGDGLLVGAVLLKSILEDGALSRTPPPEVYPQVQLNLPVRDRSVASDPDVQALALRLKEELKDARILVRASGTENLVRIMVEHPSAALAKSAALRLKEEVLKRA